MATIRRDAVGSGGDWGQEGFVYRERVVAENVTGSDLATAVYNAFNDASVPDVAASRTLGTETLYVNNRTVRSVALKGANANIELELIWKKQQIQELIISSGTPDDDGAGVATVGAVVETVQTEFDRLGAEITVKRETGAPDIIQPVQYRRARPVIEFSRWENSNPRSRAETHVGTLNSSIWNGYAAEKVLCTGIVGTTRDGGDSFDVRYTFEVKSDTLGWNTTVVYIDEDTGRPISPLVDTVSKKTIELYDTSNFGLLNISL